VDGIHSLPVRRSLAANDLFTRGRACAFCLGGELRGGLTIEGGYSELREGLVIEAAKIQGRAES
jgi:hypothetical protein